MPASLETHSGPPDEGNAEYEWEGPFLHAHFMTDVGRKRAHNEDAFTFHAPRDTKIVRDKGLLFCVADGMGGVKGGSLASHLALETMVDTYFSQKRGSIPDRLQNALAAANERVFEEAKARPDFHGMGTTVTAVLIDGQYAYIAHVGDSRLYLSRNGTGAVQITQDHSIVAEQVRSGIISEDEARTHALKNLITRAVGTKDRVQVDLYALRLRVGDTLLICSDGLSNVVDDRAIGQMLTMSSIKGAGRLLVGRALQNGGPDNITAGLLRITKPPPATELQSGAKLINPPDENIFSRFRSFFK
jgi:serine/threonine protein phosphatase PrpC